MAFATVAAVAAYVGGEKVVAGNIIVRQCGTKWHPGNNVGLGTDYTIYSLIVNEVGLFGACGVVRLGVHGAHLLADIAAEEVLTDRGPLGLRSKLVVLDRHVRRDVGVGLDLRAVADLGVVLHAAAATHDHAFAQRAAFANAHLEQSPFVNAQSDIDGHQVNVPGRRQPLGTFTLFSFSAKFDPVETILVQNHRTVIPDFYGVTTSFMRRVLKPGVSVLAEEEGAPWTKYLHGNYGKGSWTYLGGHDPEDPQHGIGNPPTDLSLHPNSPGYRLILNNVLFPAAKKKPLKT